MKVVENESVSDSDGVGGAPKNVAGLYTYCLLGTVPVPGTVPYTVSVPGMCCVLCRSFSALVSGTVPYQVR